MGLDIYLSASISEGKLSADQGLHILWPVKTKTYTFNMLKVFKEERKKKVRDTRKPQDSRVEHDLAEEHVLECSDGTGTVNRVIAFKSLIKV